jgi:hypothetical protein
MGFAPLIVYGLDKLRADLIAYREQNFKRSLSLPLAFPVTRNASIMQHKAMIFKIKMRIRPARRTRLARMQERLAHRFKFILSKRS